MLIAPEQSTEAKSSTKRRTGEKKRTKKINFVLLRGMGSSSSLMIYLENLISYKCNNGFAIPPLTYPLYTSKVYFPMDLGGTQGKSAEYSSIACQTLMVS